MTTASTIKKLSSIQGQLANLGYSNTPALSVQGTISEASGSNTTLAAYNGCQALVIDYDSATWATLNRRAVVVAIPAGLGLPASFFTQSHAAGQILEGSTSFALLVEGSAATTAPMSAAKVALDKFHFDLMHHLRGELGSQVRMLLADTAVQPQAGGTAATAANGSTPDANLTDLGTLIAYKFATAGGV